MSSINAISIRWSGLHIDEGTTAASYRCGILFVCSLPVQSFDGRRSCAQDPRVPMISSCRRCRRCPSCHRTWCWSCHKSRRLQSGPSPWFPNHKSRRLRNGPSPQFPSRRSRRLQSGPSPWFPNHKSRRLRNGPSPQFPSRRSRRLQSGPSPWFPSRRSRRLQSGPSPRFPSRKSCRRRRRRRRDGAHPDQTPGCPCRHRPLRSPRTSARSRMCCCYPKTRMSPLCRSFRTCPMTSDQCTAWSDVGYHHTIHRHHRCPGLDRPSRISFLHRTCPRNHCCQCRRTGSRGSHHCLHHHRSQMNSSHGSHRRLHRRRSRCWIPSCHKCRHACWSRCWIPSCHRHRHAC